METVEAVEAAKEIESLGYQSIYIPARGGGEIMVKIEHMLAATTSVSIATGIINVWHADPKELALWCRRITETFGSRFVLGLGVGHRDNVEKYGLEYRPLVRLRWFLDEFERAIGDSSRPTVLLAALGPRMLQFAREHTDGVHAFMVNTERVAGMRSILGPSGQIVVEHKVGWPIDERELREFSRAYLRPFCKMQNYLASLKRMGFSESEFVEGPSDRVVDQLVVSGRAESVHTRLKGFFDSGADQVCLQFLSPFDELPRAQWRQLARTMAEGRL